MYKTSNGGSEFFPVSIKSIIKSSMETDDEHKCTYFNGNKMMIRKQLALFSFIGCIFYQALLLGQTATMGIDADSKKSQDKIQVSNYNITAPALEGAINPDMYYVGPSDIISVNIWLSPPVNFILTVTPEGTLVVPTVGEVKIADLSLAEAKKQIIREIKKKYLMGEPSVTLVSPRRVLITVKGDVAIAQRVSKLGAEVKEDVAKSQQVTLLGTDRVEAAIRLSGGSVTNRNIMLKHKDGTSQRVDIPKYYALKDDRWNPVIRDGDDVFIPKVDANKNVISIWGGVNVEGAYEYVDGDTFLDLLQLAQGFTRRAIQDSVLLYRYDKSGQELSVTVMNAKNIAEGTAENLPLKRFDKIVVIQRYDAREDYGVTISGEVLYPGYYPIVRDGTKLSTVIERAGGFTSYAALHAAQLFRSSIPTSEIETERLLSLRGNVTTEDTAYYSMETALRIKREIVQVDFQKLFVQKDTIQDVVLHTGDRIVVPSKLKTIYVFGQVAIPGDVPFVEGRDASYYINAAGGYTDDARRGDMMIIKRATHQWLVPSETTIEEGDQVWVPKKPERTFAYYMTVFSQTAAVITAAVSIALLAIQLK
jgi:protein involved in polysaccharide export with SLBB domain